MALILPNTPPTGTLCRSVLRSCLKKSVRSPPPGQGPLYKYILLINFCLENVCLKLGVELIVGSLTGQHRLSTLYGQHCPFRHQILWVNFRVMTTRKCRIFVLESFSCILLSGGFLKNTMRVQVATCKWN